MIGSQQGGPGREYWYGCLAFVFDAYRLGVHPNPSPLREWVNVPIGSNTYPSDIWGHFTHGKVGLDKDPPAGALVFWDSTGGGNSAVAREDSHVAISLGHGMLISTNVDQKNVRGYEGIHEETMAQFASNSWNIYKGWWLPDA